MLWPFHHAWPEQYWTILASHQPIPSNITHASLHSHTDLKLKVQQRRLAWHSLTMELISNWVHFPQVFHSTAGFRVLWWVNLIGCVELGHVDPSTLTFFTPRFTIWGVETQTVAIQTGWGGYLKHKVKAKNNISMYLKYSSTVRVRPVKL